MRERPENEFTKGRGCHAGVCQQGAGGTEWGRAGPHQPVPSLGNRHSAVSFCPVIRAGFFFAYPGHVCLPNRSPCSVRPQADQSNWSCRPKPATQPFWTARLVGRDSVNRLLQATGHCRTVADGRPALSRDNPQHCPRGRRPPPSCLWAADTKAAADGEQEPRRFSR